MGYLVKSAHFYGEGLRFFRAPNWTQVLAIKHEKQKN